MSYKEFLLAAIKMTASIAIPMAVILALLVALGGGLTVSGSLEMEGSDSLSLLLLIPALALLVCVLVSPVARFIFAFLDRRSGKSTRVIQPDSEIKS